MKKGDIRIKEINGKQIECCFLGKGRFSTCWEHDKTVYSYTKGDWGKELVNLWCDTTNKHLPTLSIIDVIDSPEIDTTVYKMPLYYPLKAKTKAWKHYKVLKNLWDEAQSKHFNTPPVCVACIDKINDFNQSVQDSNLPGSLKEAIDGLAYNMLNYDKMLFEFTPRNLAVDKKGNLVLLDVIFSITQL